VPWNSLGTRKWLLATERAPVNTRPILTLNRFRSLEGGNLLPPPMRSHQNLLWPGCSILSLCYIGGDFRSGAWNRESTGTQNLFRDCVKQNTYGDKMENSHAINITTYIAINITTYIQVIAVRPQPFFVASLITFPDLCLWSDQVLKGVFWFLGILTHASRLLRQAHQNALRT
jgi:hypothetical protein